MTCARTSVFADFIYRWVIEARQTGAIRVPAGQGRVAMVSRRTVGGRLAELALNGRFEPGIVQLTGPEAISFDNVASIAARVFGRPIRYVPLDELTYQEELERTNHPHWLIRAYNSLFKSISQDRFSAVCDSSGETFESFLNEKRGI